MPGRFLKSIILPAFLFLGLTSPAQAAASYKHWRSSIKAAEESRLIRDYDNAREVLEKSAAEAAELGPESSAENSWTLGRILFESNQLPEALSVVDTALEKIGEKPVAIKLQLSRGFLLSAKACIIYEQRHYDEALIIATLARDTIENAAGKFHPELSILHGIIGKIYEMKKDYPKAEAAYKAALKLAESRQLAFAQQWSGPESGLVRYQSDNSAGGLLFNHVALGNLYAIQQRYKEAEDLFSKGVKAAENKYGKKGQPVIIPLSARAQLFRTTNRRGDFENDTKRIYELATKAPGVRMWTIYPLWQKLDWELKDGNATAATQTAEKIADVFAVQNYETKAMAARALDTISRSNKVDWSRASQVQEIISKAVFAKFPNDPAKTGPVLAGFALAAEAAQQTNIARANFQKLLDTQESANDKALYIASAGKLAEMLIAENKPAEALPLYQKMTATLREKYGDDSRVANSMDREAGLLKQLGQTQASTELEAKASAVRARAMLKR